MPMYRVHQAELPEKHGLMVQQNFAAQVDAFVMQTQRRMLAAFRTAAQFVIEDMIDRVPVDTGFLRASVVVSLDGSRPLDRPLPAGSKPKQYELNPQYTLAIAGTEIGNTIWASFTANYGAHVEYGTNGRQGRGMVRLAAQNWPAHVARASDEVRKQSGA